MAGLELLSDQGYRIDGRKATELRKIQARMGVFAQADGSAYLEQGNTKALAVVYGPHEVRSIGGWTFEAPRYPVKRRRTLVFLISSNMCAFTDANADVEVKSRR